jgi:hypothetical protein
MTRKIKLKPNDMVIKCPKCGNNTEFEANSSQVSEDCCEVWVVCTCGFDPTSEILDSRYEDVWGGTDNNNVMMALDCWNYAIEETYGSTS